MAVFRIPQLSSSFFLFLSLHKKGIINIVASQNSWIFDAILGLMASNDDSLFLRKLGGALLVTVHCLLIWLAITATTKSSDFIELFTSF